MHDAQGRFSPGRIALVAPMLGTGLLLFMLLLAVAWWAWYPLPALEQPAINLADAPPDETETAANDGLSQRAFDETAFHVQLWNPPPAPQAVVQKDEPPSESERAQRTPLRLELIGLVHEGAIHHAVLYDPEHDVMHIVPDGGTLAQRTVRITIANDDHRESFVEFIAGRQVDRLFMQNATSSRTGGSR